MGVQEPISPTFESVLRGGPIPELDWSGLGHESLLPELFIGFTRPQGTEDKGVTDGVTEELDRHHYYVHEIRVSKLLRQAAIYVSSSGSNEPFKEREGYARIIDLMRWGDTFRKAMTPYEMARFAIAEIYCARNGVQAVAAQEGKSGVAYLIRHLMHPAEVSFLRSVYKQRFFMIATHQSLDERRERLVAEFGVTGSESPHEDADRVLRIDAGDRPSDVPDKFPWDVAGDGNSLNINETFHKADVFVEHRSESYRPTLERWARQVFAYPWGAPTREEFGMGIAFAAARESVSLGRSVGASLVNVDGSVIAMGWNDPAHPQGGVSREGDNPDYRDHASELAADPSDQNRIDAVAELLQRLFDSPWEDFYADDKWPKTREPAQQELFDWMQAMRKTAKGMPRITKDHVRAMALFRPLTSSRAFNLIEFGRSVHAEMAAITDAARRGVATQGATMYVTTFPCHECSRNIVAAGIEKVIFVEPYGKSMSDVLYKDTIRNGARDHEDASQRIEFHPYSGISPTRFEELFSTMKRKHGLKAVASDFSLGVGEIVEWKPSSSKLRNSIQGYSEPGPHNIFFETAGRLGEHSIVSGLADHMGKAFPVK